MSTSNFIGSVVNLFTGKKCEGTWSIRDGHLKISFDRVPKSWLNQNIRIFGFGFRANVGGFLTKMYNMGFTIFKTNNWKIKKISNSEMKLTVATIVGEGATYEWTKSSE